MLSWCCVMMKPKCVLKQQLDVSKHYSERTSGLTSMQAYHMSSMRQRCHADLQVGALLCIMHLPQVNLNGLSSQHTASQPCHHQCPDPLLPIVNLVTTQLISIIEIRQAEAACNENLHSAAAAWSSTPICFAPLVHPPAR